MLMWPVGQNRGIVPVAIKKEGWANYPNRIYIYMCYLCSHGQGSWGTVPAIVPFQSHRERDANVNNETQLQQNHVETSLL